ncbi:hypothetical protein MTO96_025162 [Rhipicephalus appendiculatus]
MGRKSAPHSMWRERISEETILSKKANSVDDHDEAMWQNTRVGLEELNGADTTDLSKGAGAALRLLWEWSGGRSLRCVCCLWATCACLVRCVTFETFGRAGEDLGRARSTAGSFPLSRNEYTKKCERLRHAKNSVCGGGAKAKGVERQAVKHAPESEGR